MSIDGPNTTRALNRLEQEGYVTREVDPQDKRAYRVYLTDKAWKIRARIHQLMTDWETALLANLSEEERDTFTKLLKKLGHTVADNYRCLGCHLARCDD